MNISPPCGVLVTGVGALPEQGLDEGTPEVSTNLSQVILVEAGT